MSTAFQQWLRERGRAPGLLPPHPQQNGVAERRNGTLLSQMRTMLAWSGLPKHWWGEAILAANDISNCLSSSVLPNQMTPQEAWLGTKPDVGVFKVFGCQAVTLIPADKRTSKAGSVGKRVVHIRRDHRAKGYLFYDPATQKSFVSRDVQFLEDRPAHELRALTRESKLPQIPTGYHYPEEEQWVTQVRREEAQPPPVPDTPVHQRPPHSPVQAPQSTQDRDRERGATSEALPSPPEPEREEAGEERETDLQLTPQGGRGEAVPSFAMKGPARDQGYILGIPAPGAPDQDSVETGPQPEVEAAGGIPPVTRSRAREGQTECPLHMHRHSLLPTPAPMAPPLCPRSTRRQSHVQKQHTGWQEWRQNTTHWSRTRSSVW